MPVTDVILHRELPLTVSRPGTETVANGYVTTGVASITGVKAHCQPMSDRELRNVPEGQNTLEWYNIWSRYELKVKDIVTDGVIPSVVVQKVITWPWQGRTFWKASACKVTDATALPAPGP